VLAAAVGGIAARTAVAVAVAQAGLRRADRKPRAVRRAGRRQSTMGRSNMIFIVKPRGSEIPAAHEA